MLRTRHVLPLVAILAAMLPPRPACPQNNPSDAKPRTVKLPGLQIDLKEKRVVGKAVVVLREGPLELFACAANTKEHESVLAVRFVPSQLHMALLAIGLKPGHPMSYDPKLQSYLPACGYRVKIQVRWQDQTGQTHIGPITDWMVNSKTNKTMAPRDFIFAGSVKLPDGRYLADLDGTVITVANFASSVLDIPGRYSTKNELLVWAPKTDAIPPLGTEVELIFSPGRMVARPTISIAVDRFGRLDVAVLNAGIFHVVPFEETTTELWDRTLAVNLTGAFLCARRVLPGMREQGWGRVIMISSMAGKNGAIKPAAAYAASTRLSQCSETGARKSNVSPYFMDTLTP